MPLAQVPNCSLTLAPHFLGEHGVTMREPLERIPRPQIVSRRAGRIDKIQIPASDLSKKEAASLGVGSQLLDVLPEHVEDLVVEVHENSLIWC